MSEIIQHSFIDAFDLILTCFWPPIWFLHCHRLEANKINWQVLMQSCCIYSNIELLFFYTTKLKYLVLKAHSWTKLSLVSTALEHCSDQQCYGFLSKAVNLSNVQRTCEPIGEPDRCFGLQSRSTTILCSFQQNDYPVFFWAQGIFTHATAIGSVKISKTAQGQYICGRAAL